jgi:hypothetical protein
LSRFRHEWLPPVGFLRLVFLAYRVAFLIAFLP